MDAGNMGRSRWFGLCKRIGASRGYWVSRQYDVLAKHYAEPHRAYHDMEHIGYCLTQLDLHRDLAFDFDAVEFAFWLHDVIYHTYERPKGLPSNEALSAALADEMLCEASLGIKFRTRVNGLIMVTQHRSGAAKTRDEMLMADIDWSPLGWPWEEFLANREKIRREYSRYTDKEFAVGRAKWIASVCERESHFYLPEFKAKYDKQVRANLERETALLSA